MSEKPRVGRPDKPLGPEVAAIGHVVRAARQADGLTQTNLARRMGADRSTISKIERGALYPSEPFRRRLEETLGIVPGNLEIYVGYSPADIRRTD